MCVGEGACECVCVGVGGGHVSVCAQYNNKVSEGTRQDRNNHLKGLLRSYIYIAQNVSILVPNLALVPTTVNTYNIHTTYTKKTKTLPMFWPAYLNQIRDCTLAS